LVPVEGFEVLQSVDAPNLDVAVVHLMNRELERATITNQYKGAKYAQRPGEKTLWVVFSRGRGPAFIGCRALSSATLGLGVNLGGR